MQIISPKLTLIALVIGMAVSHVGPAAAQDLVLEEGDTICASYNDCATVMTYNGRQRLVPTDNGGRTKIMPQDAPTITKRKNERGMGDNTITIPEAVEKYSRGQHD